MCIYSDAFNALQDFYMLWMELYAEYSINNSNEVAAHMADLAYNLVLRELESFSID